MNVANQRVCWPIPLAMLIAALGTAWLSGQEPPAFDPFGEVKAIPKAAPAATEKKKGDEAVETDEVVLGIAAGKPATPAALMQAAINLVNYGRPDAAKPYLAALLALPADGETSWQLQRRFGSAPFFRFSTHPDLQPEGKQLSDRVLDGANQYARDPARLAALIDQLRGPQPELRHAALVDLREAGLDAAVALIQVLGDESKGDLHPVARSALVELQKLAIEPAIAALDSSDARLRTEITQVLGRMRARAALPWLLQPFFTAPTGSPEQLAAQQALQQILQALPTRDAAERFLFREVQAYFQGRLPGPVDAEQQLDLWQWDAMSQRPVRIKLDVQAGPVVYAARLADELVALAPQNDEYQLWHVAAQLDAAKQAGGWQQPLPSGNDTPFSLAVARRAQWDELLEFTLERDHIAAAVALLEVIAAAGDPSLVYGGGREPRELVQALRHPSRRVRFAALQAILRIAPSEPFAGASYVPDALGYFARTTGERRILIAHPQTERAQTLAGLYAQSGLESELVHRAGEVLQSALRYADIEFALLSDALDRPQTLEVLDQLRREPRTARLPVGILARPEMVDRMRRAVENDPWTEVFTFPADTSSAAFLMSQLMRRGERNWVSPEERLQQAAAALDGLASLAAHQPAFGFYELLPHEPAVELALTVPPLSEKASLVLGRMGSPAAQRALLGLANQNGRLLQHRQAAVAAFALAVQQRGILLTRGEILRQYDLYNASATADAGTQQVLGAILDTIENPTATE